MTDRIEKTQQAAQDERTMTDAQLKDCREKFEAIFKTPSHCTWIRDGYAANYHNAWDAHKHVDRFIGFKAAYAAALSHSEQDRADAERNNAIKEAAAVCMRIAIGYMAKAGEGKISSVTRRRNNWKADAANECEKAVLSLVRPS